MHKSHRDKGYLTDGNALGSRGFGSEDEARRQLSQDADMKSQKSRKNHRGKSAESGLSKEDSMKLIKSQIKQKAVEWLTKKYGFDKTLKFPVRPTHFEVGDVISEILLEGKS